MCTNCSNFVLRKNTHQPLYFKVYMIKKIFVTAVLLTFFFYSGILQAHIVSLNHTGLYLYLAKPAFNYKIIPAPNNTWGYNILRDNKIFIHQPNRPGLPGNEGFSAKEDAIKVARLVIAKIKKGEMPPTVSPHELRALKLTT